MRRSSSQTPSSCSVLLQAGKLSDERDQEHPICLDGDDFEIHDGERMRRLRRFGDRERGPHVAELSELLVGDRELALRLVRRRLHLLAETTELVDELVARLLQLLVARGQVLRLL